MSDRTAVSAPPAEPPRRFDAAATAVAAHPHFAPARSATRWIDVAGRAADYLELTKPRIALLVLITVTAGYALASRGEVAIGPLLKTLFGVALAAAGSSALNQYFERRTDARMRRTMLRPLPAGRLSPAEVLAFGIVAGIAGPLYLAAAVNPLTALLTASTVILYALVYTPLKRMTSLCTAVGAIPGALPPVLGWAAARGTVGFDGFTLFAILFLWQFPHFLAIAWLYREQYHHAGLRMLPSGIPAPRVTGLLASCYALALLPISLLPARIGLAGDAYLAAAVVLGIGYLTASLRFFAKESVGSARALLWTSLVYLPVLLTALVWDHFRSLLVGH